MIAFLRGRVLEKQPNRIIVDVAGVGYDVAVPLSTYYAAGEAGAEISLRIHTHVREEQLALFGFATPLELTVFERMIAVSGIGPKLALSVLSGIEPREFVAAIQRAERIVVELRDRLPKAVEAAGGGVAPPSPEDAMQEDLVSALSNLGYHRQAIDKALDKVLSDSALTKFEDILRASLKELSRG
jgi:Holliday junction DNA helicase RuvA